MFDNEGVMLGTVAMPKGFGLFQAGVDFVLGKCTDDLDVEHIQVYELIKGEG